MIWVGVMASGVGKKWTTSKSMRMVLRLFQTMFEGSANGLELLKTVAVTLLLFVPLSVVLYFDIFLLVPNLVLQVLCECAALKGLLRTL